MYTLAKFFELCLLLLLNADTKVSGKLAVCSLIDAPASTNNKWSLIHVLNTNWPRIDYHKAPRKPMGLAVPYNTLYWTFCYCDIDESNRTVEVINVFESMGYSETSESWFWSRSSILSCVVF